MKISIPARKNAPATQLYVKIVAKDETKLGKRPVIFILPGGPGVDHTVYLGYNCLIDVTDLVYHDPRGIGQSDHSDPATYTMDNYIDDVEAIRQHLKINPVIILGKSYGSKCAVGYAIKYPQTLGKLILSAGAPSFRFLKTAQQNLQRWGTPEQIKISEKLWDGEFRNNEELAEFFKVMAPLYSMKAKKDPGSYTPGKSSAGYSYQATNLGFSDFLRHFNYEADLHKITCPTLILAGELDWVNDVKYAKLMAEKIPHNRLKIFAGSGHAMETDVGEEYYQEIRNFIGGHGKS